MPDIRPTVLVLDDDPLTLELYSRELSVDCRVITSNDVQHARQLLLEQKPDLLVIEPAINCDEGWLLLHELQAAKNPPLVILCSVQDERIAGMGQGASAYLVKPVLPDTLHFYVEDQSRA